MTQSASPFLACPTKLLVEWLAG